MEVRTSLPMKNERKNLQQSYESSTRDFRDDMALCDSAVADGRAPIRPCLVGIYRVVWIVVG